MVTPPATEVLTLVEITTDLKIDGTAEDTWLTPKIPAARALCENIQGRRYITQTWEKYMDSWPTDRDGNTLNYIRLVPGVQSVTLVKYTDRDGVEHTLDVTEYEVDDVSVIGRVVLAPGKSWPSGELRAANGICVRFICGYGDAAADVPEEIKQAIKMVIGHWRRNPEAVLVGSISKEVEFAVRALLSPDEVMRV